MNTTIEYNEEVIALLEKRRDEAIELKEEQEYLDDGYDRMKDDEATEKDIYDMDVVIKMPIDEFCKRMNKEFDIYFEPWEILE